MTQVRTYTERHRGSQRDTENKKNINMELNEITSIVIGCAIEVHRNLGPGLLESAYEECLAYELGRKGLMITRQQPTPVI